MKIPKSSRRYVCDACGTPCVLTVENTFNAPSAPSRCAYQDDPDVKPNWRLDGGVYEKDDEFRQGWADDGEYLQKMSAEEKDEVVRHHFDCRMQNGCPCLTVKGYECEEFRAYCSLTGSDGKDFDYADCMFRCDEHRCLTDYVRWLKQHK